MERKQKGITLMSFLIVLVVLGFFALMAMKLFPMYSEYNNLKGAMNEFAATPNAASMTPQQIFASLEKRFDIAYVSSVGKEHIKVIRAGRGAQLNVTYEVRRELFANLDVVGKFNYTVELNGTASGG